MVKLQNFLNAIRIFVQKLTKFLNFTWFMSENDGGSMGNMVTNVYAKSNYDRLHIDKALGILQSDNNNQQELEKPS